jgi:hypothetical protein
MDCTSAMAARAVSSQPASAEMSTSDCSCWVGGRKPGLWPHRTLHYAHQPLPIRTQASPASAPVTVHTHLHANRSAAHLQHAQRVVQHPLCVCDVVADGQRQAPQVGLQQQVGLGVGVVCRGEGATGAGEAVGVQSSAAELEVNLQNTRRRCTHAVRRVPVAAPGRPDPPAVRVSTPHRTCCDSATFSLSSLWRTGSSPNSAAAHSTGSRDCKGARASGRGRGSRSPGLWKERWARCSRDCQESLPK